MKNLNKKEKKMMKKFELKNKEDFIIYLQELIVRLYKCIRQQKMYLEELSNYIDTILDQNHDKDTKDIIVNEYEYSKFNDLLASCESYMLNLIGDQQQVSMSYKKFRSIISKRKVEDPSQFKVRDLDKKVECLLNNFNKMRNWSNHVPESLLNAEISMIEQGKAQFHNINPIEINIPMYYSLEYVQDLYKSSSSFLEASLMIHQSMKKDYSCLIGESVEIRKVFNQKPIQTDNLQATKISANIQGIEGIIEM